MEEFNIQGKQTSFYKYCPGTFGYTLVRITFNCVPLNIHKSPAIPLIRIYFNFVPRNIQTSSTVPRTKIFFKRVPRKVLWQLLFQQIQAAPMGLIAL